LDLSLESHAQGFGTARDSRVKNALGALAGDYQQDNRVFL
jgi:hypothetical protein